MKSLFGCISLLLLLVIVALTQVHAEDNYCCMPRGHKVTVRDSSVNVDARTNSVLSTNAMTYVHYPDLDNYRYRLDFQAEYPNKGIFPEGTTLGFITDKKTLLGYEYVFNTTHCDCKPTTRPSGIFHITCVPRQQYKYVKNISIGMNGIKAQFYQGRRDDKRVEMDGGRTLVEHVYMDNIAQIFNDPKHRDPTPLCALIHQETTSRLIDEKTGELKSIKTRHVDCSDFSPVASDINYQVPAHCPPACI